MSERQKQKLEEWASFQMGQAWGSLEAAAANLEQADRKIEAGMLRQMARDLFKLFDSKSTNGR